MTTKIFSPYRALDLCFSRSAANTQQLVDMQSLALLASPATQNETTPSQLAMSGKKMYSFSSQANMGKKGLTPKLKVEFEIGNVTPIVLNGHSISTAISSKDKIETVATPSRMTRSKTQETNSKKDTCTPTSTKDNFKRQKLDVSSSEEETVKAKKTTPVRITRSSKKLIVSDSESEISEMSEDEELAILTKKLNRGEFVVSTDENVLEDYFSAHSSKAGATSDHTLSKLSCPKMDQKSVQKALEMTSSGYKEDCQALYKEYVNLYPYWLHVLANGYNVLLYGLGSKKRLLDDFRNKHLATSCHFVVNGFFPGLTMKKILNTLSSDLLEHTGSFKNLIDQAMFICGKLENKHVANADQGSPKKLFIIVHNIDGPMLRGDTAQTVLSLLAQSPAIHLLASIDHINAPLNWDQRKLSKFNWLWHDVTTFEFYRDETSYENSLLVQQSGGLALSSLTHVTKSLTPNARGIFELLVKYQLEHKGDKEGLYIGMSFHDCYRRCREKFLVNSDMTLRAQLTEFRDHKLVRSKKGQDGVEHLLIPIDNGILKEFLEQQKDFTT